MQISLVERGDPLVARALALVEQHAPLSWVILFGGDRWFPVEYVAVAMQEEQPVGLASLAATDKEMQGGPHIIGLWVSPQHRRQGIALALVVRLASESWERYNQPATMEVITPASVALANKIYQQNIPLTCVKKGIAGELP